MTDRSAADWLAELVAFDTTSRNSNLTLIDRVQQHLTDLGARCDRVIRLMDGRVAPNQTSDLKDAAE